jgi:predicted dehydrogenase
LIQAPNATISAVASSDDVQRSKVFASQFAEKQGTPIGACSNYAELATRDDIDVIYVGNVNTGHFSAAM